MIRARTLRAFLCSTLLVTACASLPPRDAVAPTPSLIGSTIGLDHVLIWSKDPAAAEAILTDQLGFTLGGAGSYGAGIANKLVRFENRSFIEFLWLSDPKLAQTSASWAYDFARRHNGSNSFGAQVESIDAAHAELAIAGLKPDEPTSEAWDPDGPAGSKPPIVNQWRFMFLAPNAVPGDPFFVEYKPNKPPKRPAPQPNGSRKLSAVWVAVEDLDAARRAYQRAGFSADTSVDLPELQGKGLSLLAGDGNILLIAPTGEGPVRERLKLRGQHVVGISVEVTDLQATARLLQARIGKPVTRQQGPFGVALRPPTLEPLGLWIEFHE